MMINGKLIQKLNTKAKLLRKSVFEMIIEAGGGHIPSCLSIVDILTVLYYEIMDENDHFILSKGHAGYALYAVLLDKGLVTAEEIKDFHTHPEYTYPGIECSTGSLGHGLSFGCGLAYSMMKQNKKGKVYVLMGDGECQEGQVWEAALWAAHHNLSNLIAIIDYNYYQALGLVDEILSIKSLYSKFDAFRWETKMIDGHSWNSLIRAFDLHKYKITPTAILVSTTKGKGISYMIDHPMWHYRMPDEKEISIARRELA